MPIIPANIIFLIIFGKVYFLWTIIYWDILAVFIELTWKPGARRFIGRLVVPLWTVLCDGNCELNWYFYTIFVFTPKTEPYVFSKVFKTRHER